MIEIDAEVSGTSDVHVSSKADGCILRLQGGGMSIRLRLHPETADQLHAEMARAMAKPCAPRSTAAILARRP